MKLSHLISASVRKTMRSIIIFILFSSVLCDEVFNQIFNVMVNNSIDPCDDFYSHVCGVNADGDLRTLTEDMERIEFMDSTIFDDVSEYMVEIIQCTDEAYNDELISVELKKQFHKACQNGQQDTFLKNLENYFNITIDQAVTCEGNQDYFHGILKDINDVFIEEYQSKCTLVLPARHYQLWLYRNPEVINRMNTLFEITKKANYHWVEKTPWINNRKIEKKYEHSLNTTYFWYDDSVFKSMYLFTNLYSDCKKSAGMWLGKAKVIRKICVRETFKINTNDREPLWSIDNLSPYGAMNRYGPSRRTIKFYESRYILANLMKSEALFFGTTGFIMAHEMGHSIIPFQDESKLYLTKNGTSCVQNQMKKSCEYFNKGNCNTNKTFGEDGPDSFGSQVSLELVMQLMGNKFYEISEEYGKITNNRLYFYGQTAILCSVRPGKLITDSDHSSNQVRFNAIAAQSSEFQKAFQCSPESRMMRSAAEKCYLFGENAPGS